MRSFFTAAQWRWVEERFREGYRLTELAAFLGVHRETVRRGLVRQGAKPESREDLPTDERLRRYAAGEEDASLPVLLYRFGRYLLISGSRPGTQALNLQGIWNDRMQPPWSSNYTVNINTEMNYWPAEICNLSETHEPLFDLLDRLRVTGGHVAEKTFHARGATVSHNTDLWGQATPVGMHRPGSVVYGWWPLGFAWPPEPPPPSL